MGLQEVLVPELDSSDTLFTGLGAIYILLDSFFVLLAKTDP